MTVQKLLDDISLSLKTGAIKPDSNIFVSDYSGEFMSLDSINVPSAIISRRVVNRRKSGTLIFGETK